MDEQPPQTQPVKHDISPVSSPVFEEKKETYRNQNKMNSYAIPIAILFGFALIAAAIYFSGTRTAPMQQATNATTTQAAQATAAKPIRPVDSTDHIRGNPNAPIMIVEYADYDCPFCKEFHETMQQVMDKYGDSGKVAWVYRQFPIQQLHPDAPRLSLAGECVGKIGGNDAFWKFSDLLFGERGVNEFVDMSRLDEFATKSGVSAKAFEACLADGSTQAAVQADFNDAIAAGAQGTPYSVVLFAGQEGIINGAQSFQYVSSVLDTLIAKLDGTASSSAATSS